MQRTTVISRASKAAAPGKAGTKRTGTSSTRKGGAGYRCVCCCGPDRGLGHGPSCACLHSLPLPGLRAMYCRKRLLWWLHADLHTTSPAPWQRRTHSARAAISTSLDSVARASAAQLRQQRTGSWRCTPNKHSYTPHTTCSKYDGDALWLPNTTRPEWLDGSLPGDRGFDPLGLSRPSDFVQIGVDDNNINANKNFKGNVEGQAVAVSDVVSDASALSPYSEVFGLQRFRETELIHGRWAMLGVLGALVAEGVTGDSWCVGGHGREACTALACWRLGGLLAAPSFITSAAPPASPHRLGAAKAELAGVPAYAGQDLPWSLTTAAVANSLLMGGAEFFRNTQLEPEARCYPGGFFDPLNLADPANPERAFQLKTAEIKHGRLAMVAALGACATQAGALGDEQAWARGLGGPPACVQSLCAVHCFVHGSDTHCDHGTLHPPCPTQALRCRPLSRARAHSAPWRASAPPSKRPPALNSAAM